MPGLSGQRVCGVCGRAASGYGKARNICRSCAAKKRKSAPTHIVARMEVYRERARRGLPLFELGRADG